jgi:1,6-anhydro-N-acetylmuramate kinase
MSGTSNTEVYCQLLEQLERQRISQRSLGTGDDLSVFANNIGQHLSPADLLATATSAIGSCITDAIQGVDRVYLTGGGIHNAALASAIKHDGTTANLGVPTQAREAMAMAILGALAQDGQSITLSHITNRKESTEPVGWVYARP